MNQRVKTRVPARQRLAFHMKSCRKVTGISQEELAALAGLHRTYIGAIERCERNVSIDNIEKIALALNVDISELLEVK